MAQLGTLLFVNQYREAPESTRRVHTHTNITSPPLVAALLFCEFISHLFNRATFLLLLSSEGM